MVHELLTFVQRFDSALRVNVHAHTLSLDGVYVQGPDGLEFAELDAPTHEDVRWVAEHTARRVPAICEKTGRTFEGPDVDGEALVAEQPLLASCNAASAGGRGTLRLVGSPSAPSTNKRLVAEAWGINVHAGRAPRTPTVEGGRRPFVGRGRPRGHVTHFGMARLQPVVPTCH